MRILYSIVRTNQLCATYTCDKLPYLDFIQNKNKLRSLYCVVQDVDDKVYTISYTKALLANPSLSHCTTWDAVALVLKDDFMDYKVNICVPLVAKDVGETSSDTKYVSTILPHGVRRESLMVHSSTHNHFIEAGYTNINLNMKDDIHRVNLLPDIYVSCKDPKIKLSNCVIVCNGVCVRTVKYGDKLYGLGGVKYFKDRRDWIDREVLLLDFTKLGNITNVKLTADNTSYNPATGALEFTSPLSLTGCSIIPVISGKMVFPWRYRGTRDGFSINTYLSGIRGSLLSNKLKTGENIFNSSTYESNYIFDYFNNLDPNENFVIVIDNKDITYERTKEIYNLCNHAKGLDSRISGLCMDSFDNSILSYVNVKYDTVSVKHHTPSHCSIVMDQLNEDNIDNILCSTNIDFNTYEFDTEVFHDTTREPNEFVTICKTVEV